jgi:hypothetical protein
MAFTHLVGGEWVHADVCAHCMELRPEHRVTPNVCLVLQRKLFQLRFEK